MSISAYLHMQLTACTMSYSWSPMARMSTPDQRAVLSKRTCPLMTIMGRESSQAPRTPVMALVPPGPLVTQQRAGRL